MASWECWDAGLIPSLAQWVKDLVLPQLQLRLQPQLRCDPWPGNSIHCRVGKKETEREREKKKEKEKLWGDTDD